MATTYSFSGSLTLTILAQVVFSGETVGIQQGKYSRSITMDPTGGDAPTVSGFLSGGIDISTTPVDMLLAAATDPLQGAGSAEYSPGFTVAGSKIKYFYLRNSHATGSITISRGAANGLPIFDAASDAITVLAGSMVLLEFKAGTAALTTTSNDKLTIVGSAAHITADILVVYGP